MSIIHIIRCDIHFVKTFVNINWFTATFFLQFAFFIFIWRWWNRSGFI